MKNITKEKLVTVGKAMRVVSAEYHKSAMIQLAISAGLLVGGWTLEKLAEKKGGKELSLFKKIDKRIK